MDEEFLTLDLLLDGYINLEIHIRRDDEHTMYIWLSNPDKHIGWIKPNLHDDFIASCSVNGKLHKREFDSFDTAIRFILYTQKIINEFAE